MGAKYQQNMLQYLHAECRCPIIQRKFMRWMGANCCIHRVVFTSILLISVVSDMRIRFILPIQWYLWYAVVLLFLYVP